MDYGFLTNILDIYIYICFSSVDVYPEGKRDQSHAIWTWPSQLKLLDGEIKIEYQFFAYSSGSL